MTFDITKEVTLISDQITDLKARLEEYITDKSFPLEERWDSWYKTPTFLKNHEGSMHSFQVLDNLDIDSFDDLSCEKYEVINLDNFVDRLEDDHLGKKGLTQELIDQIKEEILQENLGSFTLDW